MAALGSILAWRFQGAPESGYQVQMGEGDPGVAFLAFWNEALMGRPAPTQAEIDSWNLPASKYYQRRVVKRLADIDYEAIHAINGEVMDIYKDRLIIKIARGLALTNAEIARRDQMASIANALEAKMDQITAATTVTQVEAVTWP